MKIVKSHRIHLIIIFVIISFLSCVESDLFVDCNECYSIEPDSADLVIYVTIEAPYNYIPLIIYKNQTDDEEIEYIDTAYSSPYYLYVPVNEYYSVRAEYKTGDKTIYAVDGDKIKTRLVSGTCETDCYVISGGILDAKLKKF